MYDMRAYTRKVTQAYIHSKMELEKEVYIHPPKELFLSIVNVLRVVKPLYGVPSRDCIYISYTFRTTSSWETKVRE